MTGQVSVREKVRANFDRGAGEYARFERETGFFAELLRDLLAGASAGPAPRVLDVGCGSGASVGALLEAGWGTASITGIDISGSMLAEANSNYGGRASFVLADAQEYDRCFCRGFEAVVYNAVLFMLPDAARSLASAAAVLMPGGVVLASYLDGVGPAGGAGTVQDLLRQRGHRPGHHAVSSREQVEEALAGCYAEWGSRPVVREMSPRRFVEFYGQQPMSAGLLPRLPYGERRAAIAALAEEYAGQGGGFEQRWTMYWARAVGP